MKMIVSCDHVHPDYRLNKEPIAVHTSKQTADGDELAVVLYYAVHFRFGCGRDYPTPEKAVIGLLRASDCSNIRFEKDV